MQPLGRNQGSYCGERIHVAEVLGAIGEAAERAGWGSEVFLDEESRQLFALTLRPRQTLKKVYISAGIHGDEPAGPMAVLQLLRAHEWPEDTAVWLCPCLNPTGFRRNYRENAERVDLNRDYRSPVTLEIMAHTDWLNRQPSFDFGVHLHEDWESKGFYLYELNPNEVPAKSREMIDAVQQVCPVDQSAEIEGWGANHGVIHPPVKPHERKEWPEAFFMVQSKTMISYTLEAPSDFPLTMRVAALQTAVNTLLR
ncbi:MAG: M14 family metallopeptidase [Limisphaerales bacterium]